MGLTGPYPIVCTTFWLHSKQENEPRVTLFVCRANDTSVLVRVWKVDFHDHFVAIATF